MSSRKMTRDRAKAALKKLKKEGRLPRNYPLAAYYKLHLLQEKGERLLAQTQQAISERDLVQVVDDTGAPLDVEFADLGQEVIVAESVSE